MNDRWRACLAKLWWGDASEASIGRRGERAAARWLHRRGYRVLARNLRVRSGEADLVVLAPGGSALVVVEVKTRRVRPGDSSPAHPPEANIHAHKRAKLVQVAGEIARRFPNLHPAALRIDVVAVEWPVHGPAVIRHHPDAVRPR